MYLCRDCSKSYSQEASLLRCSSCGSPRIISHKELCELSIAHIDCDAFYASIEKRDNPELADKPVIIGGEKRGVVATCCYIARQSGIHSAMPTLRAKKLCPEAIFIKPNMEKYVAASKQIFSLLQELTPLVEPVSIDEAFLDLRGTSALHKAFPAQILSKTAKKIEQQVGISVSIGLSHNKFLAKMASDLDKPRGFSIVGVKETVSFLAPKPINNIFGVGKVFSKKLKKDGFLTIGQLQKHPRQDLIMRYGEMGASLARLSHGEDDRIVKIGREAKSVSTEITFSSDISEYKILSTKLLELCENLSNSLKKKQLIGDTITLKLKTKNFELRTRTKHIMLPTQLAHIIYEIAHQLLMHEIDGTDFRLIGIGISGLQKGKGQDPIDLIEPQVARKAAAERAMDKVRSKFGQNKIVRGKLYRNEGKSDNKKIEGSIYNERNKK